MQPQPIRQKPEPVKIEELRDAVEHIAFEMYYFVTYLNIRKDSKNYLKFIKHPSPTDTVPRCVPQGMGYEAHFPHIVTLIARFKEALPPDYRAMFDAKWKYWEQGD
jgi:hypothetical protein